MAKILKNFSKKEWLQLGISLFFIVTQVWVDLKIPDFMSKITMLVQMPGSKLADIWLQGGYMLLCTLGSVISSVIVGFYAARIAASFSYRLRSMLFTKVDSFSMEEINKFSTGSLITRSTNDVVQIQMLITIGIQVMIKAPITAVWAISKIAGKNFEWTAMTGGAVVVIMIAIATTMFFVLPKFKVMQTYTDNLNNVARDGLTGLRITRAYNAEKYQEEKFEKVNEDLNRTKLFTSRGMAVMMPTMWLSMNVLNLSIFWLGAVMIQDAQGFERLTLFSNMVVFSSYAIQVIVAFIMMSMMFVLWPRASVSANRINEIIQTETSIVKGTERQGRPGIEGKVEFKNVSFKYAEATEYVLKDISFTAEKGETVAFIGATGSGKSSLINLVPRFFDVTEGQVLVDDLDVREYVCEELYAKIGYVPQKAVIFSGSVAENVAFGKNYRWHDDYVQVGLDVVRMSEEEVLKGVRESVKIAQAKEFVEAMDGDYKGEISRSGTNISGGQKQRVSIARAIYGKPEIYVFDDSFSALDYRTDKVLRAALKEETKGVTTMIVAQRIGTIMDADQIIVLDEGKIVGKGRHKELLETCQIYREIVTSQFSEEELANESK